MWEKRIFADDPIFSHHPIFGKGEEIPTPPAPTPFDRQLPDPDGMDDYTTTFTTAVEGGVIIGIAGKNNSALPPDFTVTVNGDPVQVLTFAIPNRLSGSFTWMAMVPSLEIGEHTIHIEKNGETSQGTAALRIIETDPLPEGWLGEVKSFASAGTANGIAIGLSPIQAGSMIVSISAWSDRRAYPPSLFMRMPDASYDEQTTVRTDLIRDTTACGFFRSLPTTASPYYSYRCANAASNGSVSMVELRGVTLRS